MALYIHFNSRYRDPSYTQYKYETTISNPFAECSSYDMEILHVIIPYDDISILNPIIYVNIYSTGCNSSKTLNINNEDIKYVCKYDKIQPNHLGKPKWIHYTSCGMKFNTGFQFKNDIKVSITDVNNKHIHSDNKNDTYITMKLSF